MNNLKEFELAELCTVLGGARRFTVTGGIIEGVGDGIKGNTRLDVDLITRPKK